MVRCFSTTCRRNCFCSSSTVIILLNSCIKATPRSAGSLTTFKFLTTASAATKSLFVLQNLGSVRKKLCGICRASKKKTVFFLSQSQITVFPICLQTPHAHVLTGPPLWFNAKTILTSISFGTSGSKNANPIRCSFKYHK